MYTNRTRTFCVLVFGVVLAAMSVASMADEKPTVRSDKPFASPGEAYEAFRHAHTKRDWLAVFACLTPELQELRVFEAFFASETALAHEELIDIRRRFGADAATINAAYCREYRKKHHVDLAKLQAEREGNVRRALKARMREGKEEPSDDSTVGAVPEPPGGIAPSLPASDEELVREVVSRQIRDKAAFYAAICETLTQEGWEPRYGKLDRLTIGPDTATGRARRIVFLGISTHGEPPRKVAETVYETFYFRRVKSGWLLDAPPK